MAPEVAVVRRMYAAVAMGDLAGVQACFAEDALRHIPGTSAIAGDHRGRAAIRKLIETVRRLSGDTFRAELVDVAVGEQYVVAVQHATARG